MAWYPATVTVPPTAEPVTIERARTHLCVDGDAFDVKIGDLISSARAHVELRCGIRLMTQTIVARADGFADLARLPLAPVQSISAISYVALDGTDQTVAASVYEPRLEGLEPAVVLKAGRSWPPIQPGSRITLTAICGFASVPDDIVHVLLLRIGSGFLNVENGSDGGWSVVDSLLCNYRRAA